MATKLLTYKSLDILLKVLGVLIALLVIISVIVLLLRVVRPQPTITSTTITKPKQPLFSYWYYPYWDWVYNPYYWFYPKEKHHHHYYTSATTTTTGATTTTTIAPTEASSTTMPAIMDEPPADTTDATTEPVIMDGNMLNVPLTDIMSSEPVISEPDITLTSDIIPEITINNSLNGGVSVPVITVPELISEQPPIPPPETPDVNPEQIQQVAVEGFTTINMTQTNPEPWSIITSQPETF